MQENYLSDVWSDCVPVVSVCVCVHMHAFVIILTPLFIGMYKVSIIITSYMHCVLHTGFCVFFLYGQYIPCQNHDI